MSPAADKMATTQYLVDSDGVAVITLSYPPLNALHPKCECNRAKTSHPRRSPADSGINRKRAVLQSLFENLGRAHRDPAVKAIVVIGGSDNFSPGFDIAQFQNQSGGGGIDDKVVRGYQRGFVGEDSIHVHCMLMDCYRDAVLEKQFGRCQGSMIFPKALSPKALSSSPLPDYLSPT